jgi:hypothetical protein
MEGDKTREWYYRETMHMDYTGKLHWPRGTKQQWFEAWKTCREKLMNPPLVEFRPRPFVREAREEGIQIYYKAEGNRPAMIEFTPKNETSSRAMRFVLAREEDVQLNSDNVNEFKDKIFYLLDRLYDFIGKHKPYMRVILADESESKDYLTSTVYVNCETVLDLQKLKDMIAEKLERFVDRYDTPGLYLCISNMIVFYRKGDEVVEPIRGIARSVSQATEKWYEPRQNTRKNCMSIALFVAYMWRSNVNYLLNEKRRRKSAHNWWNSDRRKLPDSVRNNPDMSDLPILAEKLKVAINVYNNIYEITQVITPEEYKKVVNIRISNESGGFHATALIPWNDIASAFPGVHEKIKKVVEEEKLEVSRENSRSIFSKKSEKDRSNRILSWDVETLDLNGITTVYMVGITNPKDTTKLESVIQFTSGHKNPMELFADWIYKNASELNEYCLYAHNGGKFDLILLIRDVFLKDKRFAISCKNAMELNNRFINLCITCKGNKIYFRDSFSLFPSSLKSVTQEFKVDHIKLDFPDIVNVKTSDLENQELMYRVAVYNQVDCVGLQECLMKFSDIVWNRYNINITSVCTLASLSKRIFLTHYYFPNFGKGEYVQRMQYENDRYIRSSYLGGRNECGYIGIKHGKFWMYDFTSLYPYTGTFPMPYGKPKYISKCTLGQIKSNPYGMFVKVRVKGMPKTPLHGMYYEHKLCFPKFKNPQEIILYSAEILYGLSLGYTYEFLDAMEFKTKPILKKYFTDLFEDKKSARALGEAVREYIAKIIINSGYGFWGYDRFNKDSIIFSDADSNIHWDYLKQECLISHSVQGNYSIDRVLKQNGCDCNVSIASAITSLARMELHKLMIKIKSKGGNVLYCDTDSVVTDICVADYPDLVNRYMKNNGNDLGGLKNEFRNPPGLVLQDVEKYYDTFICVGCKAYSLSRSEYPDQNKNKLKGYKRKNSEGEETELSPDVIFDIANGKTVTQEQFRIMINKNDYVRESAPFEIRMDTITKRFKTIYTKGKVLKNGDVEPLVL